MAAVTHDSGVLMEDGTYSMKIGPLWDGSPPDFTSADVIGVKGIAKGFDLSQKVEKTRVSGASNVVRNRYHSPTGELTLNLFVPKIGPVSQAVSLLARGRWVQFSYETYDTTSPAIVIAGVVTEFKLSSSQGEATMENLTIDLDADTSVA